MSGKTKAKPDDGLMKPGDPARLDIAPREGEKIGRTLARATLDPKARHANVAMAFAQGMFGDANRPNMAQSMSVISEETELALSGDLALSSRVFTAQAMTLDAMFTELARRAAMNMGEYPQATERYLRLAFKAQANCRATLEALAKLHQPREQTVKHVHVADGGQAVVADHFHHHRGADRNAKTSEQCHAACPACTGAALPSPDTAGRGMPVSGGEWQAAMPDARRD